VLLLLVLPSSFVSQSSQKWHSQDLRTRGKATLHFTWTVERSVT
jgi:hypothetical protein